ncbi:MAG: PAS domain S-box protein [Bacteroidota bacterium]|jgi:PAS domain S-box-containing protein|nr:PAS domain S-box protein [Ignavibacteria bacterium]MCU7498336.1 PAS domain S-box protein [Ignavibacteria bacterium]MCU7512689.1 PAS domain S-box protein [Ignavibacteria bacterium]MCU7520230.1 PAS domain S-box protein [Ignavibacteria bacterium]MCU7523649.1 PAS domain S-box protein [Ignavibacteria bacterium]
MEQNQIARALKESEDRYRQLVEYLSDAIIVHSSAQISFINPAGLELLGAASIQQILGKAFINFVHPSDRECVQERFRKVIVEGVESGYFEERLMRLDGSEIFAETMLSPFTFQGEWAILIVTHDITGRKQTEQALRESEERFKTMVQNISGYIYSVTYKGKKAVSSYHSPQCLVITGYSPEEYQEDPDLWIKMVYKDDHDHVQMVFDSLKENPQQTRVEHRINHKDGSIRWIENTYTLQINESGEIERMDGFIIDITDRKTAENALHEQYFFLQRLIDTIPNPIFYKDINGVFQGCNIAYEKLMGASRFEIIGKTVFDLMSKSVALSIQKYDEELYRRRGVQIYETEFETRDRRTLSLILNKALYFNTDGTVAGHVGVLLDVTTLKQTQEELRRALQELREMAIIINKSPAIVFLWKAVDSWPVEFVSDNINQFGYNSEDLIKGKIKFSQIIHPDDLPRIAAEMNSFMLEEVNEFIQDYRILTKEGETRWVDDRTWIRKDESGKVTHYQGIIIDITTRKNAEQMVRESEERYRALAENSYDLISEISQDLKFLYLSPNFYDVLGYHPPELINKSILELVHPDDVPSALSSLRRESGSAALRFRHKQGEWFWFESTGKKFRTAQGENRGVIVSRDISERKRLEQQIIQTEKLMAVGEMSAMIAHEFRNALTSIKMILQLQGESENLTISEKESFGVAINSIYHMESVVQQLLNFAHPAPMESQIEDLNRVMSDCLPFIDLQAAKKSIHVVKKIEQNLPKMPLNSAGLKDAIINLVLNAAQAFDSGGSQDRRRISIMLKKVVLDETLRDYDFSASGDHMLIKYRNEENHEVVLEKGCQCVLIEISDNGPGIPEEILEKIFEPFFTTKEKGSGLGLPIVKRTVNAHGGVIQVFSRVNEGTTFRIYLPV